MALAADELTKVVLVETTDPGIKTFEVDVEITAADETTLEGAPNAAGIVTFNEQVYLPGIAGGPWLLTLSKEVPANP